MDKKLDRQCIAISNEWEKAGVVLICGLTAAASAACVNTTCTPQMSPNLHQICYLLICFNRPSFNIYILLSIQFILIFIPFFIPSHPPRFSSFFSALPDHILLTSSQYPQPCMPTRYQVKMARNT